MIHTRMYRRYFAITAGVVLFFVVLGFVISNAAMRFAMSRTGFQGAAGFELFLARLIDQTDPANRARALSSIERLSVDGFPAKVYVLDGNGTNLSGEERLPFAWDRIQKPEVPYQFTPIGGAGSNHLFRQGPPVANGLIRFSGEPVQYLYTVHGPGGPGPRGPPPFNLFLATFGSLVFSVLTGIGFALLLLFRSMREKMQLADSVIAELQSGNLKARFPIRRMDEMGQAMSRFNRMADEIERLVERLRDVEKSRIALLQDLTHDLRTPIASLKNLLSTIGKKSSSDDQGIRSELLSLSQREVDYFERLVEDLLVLAQVSEPRYQVKQDRVSILDIVGDEAESVAAHGSKEIEVRSLLAQERNEVAGDVHLLRRMLRNALLNAVSFAASRVRVSISPRDGNRLEVLIEDDGPGFSEESLKNFGERRASRSLERTRGDRLSIGLGSVIMKTVAEVHGGSVLASNRIDASGRVLGADVRIVLPCAHRMEITL